MKPFWAAAAVLLAAVGLAAGTRAAEPEVKPPSLDYRSMERLGWKLSCQAYTFREMSAFEAIDTVHNLGIRYIEFYPGQRFSKEKPDAKLDHNMPPELIEELQQKLKSANITAVNYGVVGLGSDEAGARKVFDWAKRMGLQTIVSEPGGEAVPMLDRLCQEYGINIAIHDHPRPSHYWNPDTVLKVAEGRSKRIGSCSDTGHWYRSGLVPVECLKKLEGRIISMHFKDLDESKRDVPWGTGKCDARGMLEEIKRQGVRPVISIEYESTTGQTLVDNVRKCVEWFNTQATELARSR